jgi:hypothetical protein
VADKALLLGINEYRNVNHLRGCLNDVENMRKVLTDVFGFDAKNVKSLTNDAVTKDDVQKQMKWLFRDARDGDRVVLHFSGHGSVTADPEKEGGVAELICLYDMDFADPDSYFINHELRDWSKTKPQGVQLTFVLDCCHSGEGTRLLMAPLPGKPFVQVPVRVDADATVKRSAAKRPAGARGLDVAAATAAALDPGHEDVVLVRFVDPPPAIQEKVARSAKMRARELVIADLNHILLAACRKDQTAADATIGGQPNGAFTYYLCKALREGGATVERRILIAGLEKALRDGHFDQAPQLEANTGVGPLFGDAKVGPATPSPSVTQDGTSPAAVPSAATPVSLDQLSSLFDRIAHLVPEAQLAAIKILSEKLPVLAPTGRGLRGVGDRHLVYVHGICKHDPGYSTPWWNVLSEFEPTAFGAGTLDDTRHEVLWSDLVNERGLTARGTRAVDGAQQQAAAEIREVLQDRMDRHAVDAGPRPAPGEAPRSLSDPRGFLSIPGLNCIDDFTVYLVDDSIRSQIIDRFTTVLQPLLEAGAELDIISHSWGTVVAYEGLRVLEDQGVTAPRVRNWFTVGAALSIPPVKLRLRPGNRDGHRPGMVRRWVNLNAHGDIVGGPLQGRPYQVDDDFPNLDPFGCGSFLGLVNPQCAHGSYFVTGNVAVNRDIFAAFMDQP